MLSESEQSFITYWETVRVEYSKPSSKFVRGLPAAFLFSFPIIISVIGVEVFSPDWFTKISTKAMGATWPILISMILIIIFFSFARMHFRWEMNEQYYIELKQRTNNLKSNEN